MYDDTTLGWDVNDGLPFVAYDSMTHVRGLFVYQLCCRGSRRIKLKFRSRDIVSPMVKVAREQLISGPTKDIVKKKRKMLFARSTEYRSESPKSEKSEHARLNVREEVCFYELTY